ASSTANTGEWTSLMDRLRQQINVAQPVELRIGGSYSPMTWGWLHPVILVPLQANTWSHARRSAVLIHELAHVKRRDGLTQILVQLAGCVYWFNPLVWFAERRMRLERERACDDYVLNVGTRDVLYAGHLLEIASDGHLSPLGATVSMAQPSQLEIRLRAILNP